MPTGGDDTQAGRIRLRDHHSCLVYGIWGRLQLDTRIRGARSMGSAGAGRRRQPCARYLFCRPGFRLYSQIGHDSSDRRGSCSPCPTCGRRNSSLSRGRRPSTTEPLRTLRDTSCLSFSARPARFKRKVRRRRGGSYPLSHLYGHFGLLRLSRLGHDVPSTKA